MEIEIKKLMKLKVAEQNLADLLQKIDTEINLTDVQWMHLKSLIPTRQNLTPQAEQSTLKPTVISSQVKMEHHHIDDQSVNEIQMDLSLQNTNTADGSISEDNSD